MLERSGESFSPVFFQRRAAPASETRTMPPLTLPRSASALFSHVMADNAPLYRAILDVFAASKRQFRLHLRPDDVLAEATWPGGPPTPETVQQALGQLVDWGCATDWSGSPSLK